MVLHFLLRPAPHGKVIGCYGFALVGGEGMPLRHAELMPERVELRHTAEGEGASWRDHRFLEHRLLALTGHCRLPVADIHDEHPPWTEHPGEGEKDLLPTWRVEEVVEDSTAQ